ncbi:hypothetical protein LTR85_010419 [Meristemomyces frigidus]|nr:hypothetical protein LTR85_010419 [Meristemomyces frigidus]
MRMEIDFDNYAVSNFEQADVDQIAMEFLQIQIPDADWDPSLALPSTLAGRVSTAELDEQPADVEGVLLPGGKISFDDEGEVAADDDEGDATGKAKKGKAAPKENKGKKGEADSDDEDDAPLGSMAKKGKAAPKAKKGKADGDEDDAGAAKKGKGAPKRKKGEGETGESSKQAAKKRKKDADEDADEDASIVEGLNQRLAALQADHGMVIFYDEGHRLRFEQLGELAAAGDAGGFNALEAELRGDLEHQ